MKKKLQLFLCQFWWFSLLVLWTHLTIIVMKLKKKTNTEKEDDSENNKDEPLNEEPKEDDSENNENEHFNEDDSENKVVEDKTWCEIDENINILELNYIGYYENFTAIFNSDSNDSELVKTTPFTMRCNIPSSNGGFREIVITVKYNERKLYFSINSELRTTLKGGGFLFSLQRTDLQI